MLRQFISYGELSQDFLSISLSSVSVSNNSLFLLYDVWEDIEVVTHDHRYHYFCNMEKVRIITVNITIYLKLELKIEIEWKNIDFAMDITVPTLCLSHIHQENGKWYLIK